MIVSGLRDTERGVSLSGHWKARRATEGDRRQVGDVNLDDSGWVDIEVPGLWRNVEEFRDADAVLYRHRFGLSRLDQQRRRWLTIDGLCYQGDVWFNGAYLGDTEGYFVEHCFEITDLTSQGGEHLRHGASGRTLRIPVVPRGLCRLPGGRLRAVAKG